MLDLAQALDLGRNALLISLVVSGPVLGAGLVVGVIISLLQTITQIQDQTFAIVPKIVAMLGAALLVVPWIASRLIEYTRELFSSL